MRNLRPLVSYKMYSSHVWDDSKISVDPSSLNVYMLSENNVQQISPNDLYTDPKDFLYGYANSAYLINIDAIGEDDPKVRNFTYLEDIEAICLIYKTGQIAHGDVKTMAETDKLTIIDKVANGKILAAEWDLTKHNLVIITDQSLLILLRRSITKYKVVKLVKIDATKGKNWTKEATEQEIHNQKILVDDGKPRIAWSLDSSSFLVNAVVCSKAGRQIYRFSNVGELLAKSGIVDGLETSMCYRGPNDLISIVQRLPGKCRILFWEKDLSTRCELVLPLSGKIDVGEIVADKIIAILAMNWSADQSALVIWIENLYFGEDEDGDEDFFSQSEVQVWTMIHSHWYLKQSWSFPRYTRILDVCCWHPLEDITICVFSSDGCIYRNSLVWTTDKSDCDDAVVAVIDGKNLALTSFANEMVQPRSSEYRLTFPCAVEHILFPKHHSENKMAIWTVDNKMTIFAKQFKSGVSRHVQQRVLTSEFLNGGPMYYSHWLWISPTIFLVVSTLQNAKSNLSQIKVNESSDELEIKCEIPVDGIIQGLISSCNANIAIIQLKSGQLKRYLVNENIFKRWYSFPTFCSTMSSGVIGEKELMFGLCNKDHKLFCKYKLISGDCTSFILNDEFLLFTKLDGTLNCVLLTAYFYKKENPLEKTVHRMIEKGIQIVTYVKETNKVILQTSCGKVEAVDDPISKIDKIYMYLNGLKYRRAFELMRKEKIDTNLMFDFNPKKFLDNVDEFVHQIDDGHWIDSFLTDLKEENVSEKLYRTDVKFFENKLNTVYSTVRRALIKFDSKRFMSAILTTFKKMDPIDLEQALQDVTNLDREEREEALNYLQSLTDSDLREVALRTNHRDLIPLTAGKSKEDPEENLPVIESRQKTNIEGNFQKSENELETIFQTSNFDECLQHIKSQNLYEKAFQLFTPDSENYSQLCIANAEYFNTLNKFDDAGIKFRQGGDLKKAMEAFERGLHWREAFCVAMELKFEESKMKELGERLVDRLVKEGRFEEASFIQEKYLKEVDASIRSLIDGRLWESALELISFYDKEESLQPHLQKSMKDYSKVLTDKISQLQTNFEEHVARLNVVREEKGKMSVSEFNLKKGALVEDLRKIVSEVDNSNEDCRDLLQMLSWFDFTEEGKILQSKMNEILKSIDQTTL